MKETLNGILVELEPIFKMLLIAVLSYGITQLRVLFLVKIEKIKSENTAKYLKELNDLIDDVVVYINQDYVSNLKENNLFDKEAQIVAIQKAKSNILRMASERMKKAVETVHQDLNQYITAQIEKSVAKLK